MGRKTAGRGARAQTNVASVDAARRRAYVRVDAAVYPLEAVYGAAYEMLDRAWVYLAPAGKRAVVVELRAKTAATEADLEALAGELGERLLDHSLRLSLAERYGKLRETIVDRALRGAGAASQHAGPTSSTQADDPYGLGDEWAASRKEPPRRKS